MLTSYIFPSPQAAFSPSHVVPGIEPSSDPVLQSRLFSYPDTHRHRLGVNYGQLPVNAPLVPTANFQRDGFMAINNQGSRPNYQSSLIPLAYKPKAYEDAKHELWLGHCNVDLSFITERMYISSSFRTQVDRVLYVVDFEQPRALWEKVFDNTQKDHFVYNVSGHLGSVKSDIVKSRQRQ